MMIALYSINLRIMEKSNVPLLQEETVFTQLLEGWNKLGIDAALQQLFLSIGLDGFIPKTWSIVVTMLILILVIKYLLDYFLKTELGLAIIAVGDNQNTITSFSANTDMLKIVGLGISNALVAFSGAFIAQYNGFSDVGMGIGMIVIGLASVIIGEALVGIKTIVRATLAVIIGAVIYRLIVALALRLNFFETGDMKLITACIVIGALVIPRIVDKQKDKRKKSLRRKRGVSIASTESDL
jgi:putative ABC transport system permease protein